MPSAGRTFTRVHRRSSPSLIVHGCPPLSKPVAVLSRCTHLTVSCLPARALSFHLASPCATIARQGASARVARYPSPSRRIRMHTSISCPVHVRCLSSSPARPPRAAEPGVAPPAWCQVVVVLVRRHCAASPCRAGHWGCAPTLGRGYSFPWPPGRGRRTFSRHWRGSAARPRLGPPRDHGQVPLYPVTAAQFGASAEIGVSWICEPFWAIFAGRAAMTDAVASALLVAVAAGQSPSWAGSLATVWEPARGRSQLSRLGPAQ
jgi:hypothetical protein